MADPITLGALAALAHRTFHAAHPYICELLHQAVHKGGEEGIKKGIEVVRDIKDSIDKEGGLKNAIKRATNLNEDDKKTGS